MPGYTPYYSLAYFDFGDRLDTVINARLEIDRFVTIDKQLFGLYSIFGNGTITGWDVFDNGHTIEHGISVGITPGMGVIQFLATDTTSPIFINSLTPNSTIYVYANSTATSSFDRSVNIFVSLTELTGFAIKLAVISTGSSGITSIDNTVRDYIGFEQTILDRINDHKHRNSPSKIDLENHTKNQLSGARLESFDTGKLVIGRLDQERIPLLVHNELKNIGNLTHAQIDAFIQNIGTNNLGLLGDVAAVNTLRQIIFLKYKYSNVDDFMVNEITMIPGITPRSYIDYDYTTAIVNESNHSITGFSNNSRETLFFTKNFTLPSKVNKVLLTSDKFVPVESQIIFGVNTINSVDFDNDYTITNDGSLTRVPVLGDSFRVGIKFIWNGDIPNRFNLFDNDFNDFIFFDVTNDGAKRSFHFRIRLYSNNENGILSDLFAEFDSRLDQSRWLVSDDPITFSDSIPSTGYVIDSGEDVVVSYYPDLSQFVCTDRYFGVLDTWTLGSYIATSSIFTFGIQGGSRPEPCVIDYLPRVNNFAIIFELENSQLVTLNL